MSRPWILGIVCCPLLVNFVLINAVLINGASVSWGQEYLDLPDEPEDSESSSLANKLILLKDKFRREKPQMVRTATHASRRSSPRNPRYRSLAKSSSQKQRVHRVQRNNASNQAPQPVTSGLVTRSKSNDLLPKAQLFSRTTQPLPPAFKRKAKQLTRAASLPRAGSATSKPAPPRVARISPTRSRANELDAALADLLQSKPAPRSKSSVVKSIKFPAKKATKKSIQATTPMPSNTFDLRKALLDDNDTINDTIAAEVARAVEATPEADVKAAVEVETTKPAKTTKPKVVKNLTEKPKPAGKTKAPVVVASPRPELTPPVATRPTVVEPIVVATPPKPVITIATPRPSPSVPAASSSTGSSRSLSKGVSDPFEDATKQIFSSPHLSSNPSSNPMRSFQPITAPEPITKSIDRPTSGVLQTTRQAVIVSHVEGPRSILVGREATYQVTLENTSGTPASSLSAEISVPEWAELVDAMSTSGVVERRSQGANAGVLDWKLSELAPRSSQALRLRLIPRSGRPLQLGVRWSQAPIQSQAIVEVQEPKLEIAISGPEEVRFGKAQRYRLTLRNPGTGLTEQVLLRLIPPGGDAQSATTQKIGDIKPGEVKDIDLELTAREAGALLIQANAIAEGGLKAETTKSVLCRKPELEIDWRGPDKKYAGTVAAYYFRIQNPGTAATEPVNMSVKLPAGAEFISASEGYSINTTTGIVSWRLASIEVREEQFMQLRCKIARPGRNDFELIAKTTDGELNESKSFQTDVVALADLQLEVTDPQGPLPLGEPVVYEIRVKNRGTTDAENINVVGLFSEGIDPTTVEGAQFTVRDGRVSFHPIKILPAGREVLLRINAKATQVGTHIFRTEVTCPKLDIKLAAEETTRFFEDEHRWEDGQTPYTAERDATLQR